MRIQEAKRQQTNKLLHTTTTVRCLRTPKILRKTRTIPAIQRLPRRVMLKIMFHCLCIGTKINNLRQKTMSKLKLETMGKNQCIPIIMNLTRTRAKRCFLKIKHQKVMLVPKAEETMLLELSASQMIFLRKASSRERARLRRTGTEYK